MYADYKLGDYLEQIRTLCKDDTLNLSILSNVNNKKQAWSQLKPLSPLFKICNSTAFVRNTQIILFTIASINSPADADAAQRLSEYF